ncbi:hypothetical protein [Halopseudomonas sp.]|uniref:hypothetical protein n=1 Tax=Halopseudomonas sp. TaxID=2901191 RepID=UPI003001B5C8
MLKKLIVLLSGVYVLAAQADLKPDVLECDAKRATRNAAMEATLGVSGGCDMGKATDNAMDDARDNVGDHLDDAKDNLPNLERDHDKRRGLDRE